MFVSPVPGLPAHKVAVFDRLWSSPPKAIFVLGRNVFAESVARGIVVDGFVDEFTDQKTYLGRPVLRLKDLPRDCVVISCVVDGRGAMAMGRLKDVGVTNAIDYHALTRLAPGKFKEIAFCAHNVSDIEANPAKYEWLHETLADETSRHVLQQVLQFRYSFDIEAMNGFVLNQEGQYFDPCVELKRGEVFVDGGGYDGITSLRFAARCPEHRCIEFFEPMADSMGLSQKNLIHLNTVRFHQEALYCRNGELHFDSSAGDASHIASAGIEVVKAVRLDDAVQEPISFMKLDIEGAECDAISGAERHICQERPKLAVCVYHDQAHFWQVPSLILKFCNDYRVYLRHYTQGINETIMYFIPAS